MKPKIFIGSSVEGLKIARAVQTNLEFDAEATIWKEGVFELSKTTIESLTVVLDKTDFAVFVFTPDDVATIRNARNKVVRDNVLFELGLFIGRLGRERTFILAPRLEAKEAKKFHLPTDLLGITTGSYSTERSDNNLESAISPACNKILLAVEKLGFLHPQIELDQRPQSEDKSELSKDDESVERKTRNLQNNTESNKETEWIKAFDNGEYEKAAMLIQKRINEETNDDLKIILKSFLGRIKLHINFREGQEYLKKIKVENPDHPSPYLATSDGYRSMEMFEEAIEILNEGIEKVDFKVHLYKDKSTCLSLLGQTENAIIVLDELAQLYPDFVEGYIQKSDILRDRGNIDEAKVILEKAMKDFPNDIAVINSYAHLFYNSYNNNEEALIQFRKVTKLDPKNAEAFSYLGNIYLNLKFNSLSLESYMRANELAEEKQAWILGNIGNLLSYRGFYSEAIKYLRKALEIIPNSEYSLDRLSNAVKLDQEERDKAEAIIREYKQKKNTSELIEDSTDSD